nr:hypothetical protein GCM10025732_40260 [Glycomyces mayteni]
MEPGNLIAGRYRLEQRLAAGGMGEVWRGTDTRLNRVVAVKLLHSGLSGNDRFRARFHQEAQAVAQLQSPGIVALYDYGEEHAPEGLVSYLVMELVRGKALDNVLRERRRLSPNETLKIMASAAEALDVAHQAHIIHRDIKPGNLLVDTDGSVKIVDFGIAAAKGGAGLTETGTVMGTLAYASPSSSRAPSSPARPTSTRSASSPTRPSPDAPVRRERADRRDRRAPDRHARAAAPRRPGPGREHRHAVPREGPAPALRLRGRARPRVPRRRHGRRDHRDPRHSPAAAIAAVHPGHEPGRGRGDGRGRGRRAHQPHAAAVVPGRLRPRRGHRPVPHRRRPERPLPPPRDMEQARRNPTGPILIVAAGLAVILIAFLIWAPWKDDEDDPTGAAEDPTTSAAAEETTESAPEEEENEDSGGDEEDQGQEEEQTTEERTSEEEDLADLDDFTGDNVNDALDQLASDGFTDVSAEPTAPENAEHETCEILYQEPESGGDISRDTPIVFGYVANDASCPDGDLG